MQIMYIYYRFIDLKKIMLLPTTCTLLTLHYFDILSYFAIDAESQMVANVFNRHLHSSILALHMHSPYLQWSSNSLIIIFRSQIITLKKSQRAFGRYIVYKVYRYTVYKHLFWQSPVNISSTPEIVRATKIHIMKSKESSKQGKDKVVEKNGVGFD